MAGRSYGRVSTQSVGNVRTHAERGNEGTTRSVGTRRSMRPKGNFLLAPGTDASKGFCFRSCQVKLSGSEWLLADYRNRGVIIEADFLARESRTVEPHQRVLTPFPIPAPTQATERP